MSSAGIGEILAGNLPDATLEKCAEVGVQNARLNLPHCSRSIMDLKEEFEFQTSAILIAAGPSLHRNDSAQKILRSGYSGLLIVAESALSYCVRNGLTPDFVVTLDPHPKRIIRFLGDPNLTIEDLETDDYFRRQDLDPQFGVNELKRNSDLVKLVDQYAPQTKVAISSSASSAVANRCIQSGMQTFWWNPLYDDYDDSSSVTREVFNINGLPCINTGGNVGTASWVIAHSILDLPEIALVGMDFSYYADTQHSQTQYYYELIELVGKEKLAEVFIAIENPYLKKTFYTDPTYFWYRESFLEMAQDAPCHTYNCTEGGILFGPGVDHVPLDDFLTKHS